MGLKSDLFAALSDLVSNRVTPDKFSQPSTGAPMWPAIRYSVVSGSIASDIYGSGTEQTDDVRVQIDVVSSTDAQRDTIKNAVRDRMASFARPNLLQGTPTDSHDAETNTYRAEMEFVFYGSS